MPDLDQIKQGEQGTRDRRRRFARGGRAIPRAARAAAATQPPAIAHRAAVDALTRSSQSSMSSRSPMRRPTPAPTDCRSAPRRPCSIVEFPLISRDPAIAEPVRQRWDEASRFAAEEMSARHVPISNYGRDAPRAIMPAPADPGVAQAVLPGLIAVGVP
jgi:hypothetical protein